MAAIRVALVGCGRIARVHRSYLRLPGVEVVGAWDADPQACRRFCEETGTAAFNSLEALLEQGRPEVVHILTPPPSHAPLACRLLEAGVNVFCEKPLAMNAAEAADVIDTARRRGRWVSVDHNRWFDPVVQKAAAMVREGRIGALVGVDVFQGADPADAERSDDFSDWRTQLPGGMLHNLAPHPLYLMRRFAGPAVRLHVITRLANHRLEEVRLLADGERCPAGVTLSLRAKPFSNRLTLFGTEATVEVNLNNMTLIERRPRPLPKLMGKIWPNLSEAGQLVAATVRNGFAFIAGKQRFYPGIGMHLATLYGNLRRGESPPVTVEEAYDVVAWYDEILAHSGAGATEATGR